MDELEAQSPKLTIRATPSAPPTKALAKPALQRDDLQEEALLPPQGMVASGLVEVRLVDDLDKPISSGFRVSLEVQNPDTGRWASHYAEYEQGQALFPDLGFSAAIRIAVHSDDDRILTREEGVSPKAGEEHAIFTIRPYDGIQLLAGRILNEAGMAGANRTFLFRLETNDRLASAD